jgi:hypothetical protein
LYQKIYQIYVNSLPTFFSQTLNVSHPPNELFLNAMGNYKQHCKLLSQIYLNLVNEKQQAKVNLFTTTKGVPICQVISLDFVSQPYFEKSVRMRLTLPKWRLGSPSGLLKVQSSIAKVKTTCINAFFISLESYQSVDVENGIA